jgi:hypothetical protein
VRDREIAVQTPAPEGLASTGVESRLVHETDGIATGINQREGTLAPVLHLDAIIDLLTPCLSGALVHGIDVDDGEEDLFSVRPDPTTSRLWIDAGEDGATAVKIVTIRRYPLAGEAEDGTVECSRPVDIADWQNNPKQPWD